jgi:integrase
MASSGMRIGALPHLVLGHLERRGEIYKISVYKGQKGKGQYYTFCTPEAAKAIDTYLEFRKRCGEKIEPGSPLFRKEFDVDFHEGARNRVESASIHSLRMDVFNSLVNSGLRIVDRINSSRKRKEVKMTHGFRKFFETMLVNTNLHETIIRKLTGHSQTGNLTQLYSKQTEAEMLHEYEKAIDALTIDPANQLRKKVEKLEVEKTEIQSLRLELEKVKRAIAAK